MSNPFNGKLKKLFLGSLTFTFLAFEAHASQGNENFIPEQKISSFASSSPLNIDQKFLQYEHQLLKDKTLSLKGIYLVKGYDLVSIGVEIATRSQYSHVAIALTNTQNSSEMFCFQSTPAAPQAFPNIKEGVQFIPADDWVKTYPGVVYRRDFTFRDQPPSSDKIKEFITSCLPKPYEKKVLELIELVDRGNAVEDTASVFCSELTALMLQDLGYLSKNILADNYTPGDFSSENPHLNLIDVSLSKEIELKNPSRNWKDLCQIL